MLKTERHVLSAALSVNSLNKLLNLDEDPIIEQEVMNLLLLDSGRRVPLALLWSLASPNLPIKEQKGLLGYYFLVLHGDDMFDDPDKLQRNPNNLLEDVLNTDVVGTEGRLNAADLYQRTMDCLPLEKRNTVNSYLIAMSEIHANEEHKGKPGTYGFQDARDYRVRTNFPAIEAGLKLGNSLFTEESIAGLVMGLQYLDDKKDWKKDAEEENKNLLLGMATDKEDLHYMLRSTHTIKPKKVVRSPEVKNTITAYKRAFRSEFTGRSLALASLVKMSGRFFL